MHISFTKTKMREKPKKQTERRKLEKNEGSRERWIDTTSMNRERLWFLSKKPFLEDFLIQRLRAQQILIRETMMPISTLGWAIATNWLHRLHYCPSNNRLSDFHSLFARSLSLLCFHHWKKHVLNFGKPRF